MTGSFANCCAVVCIRWWNWVARSVVHGSPESATTRSAASLDAKTEHRAVDAADNRNPVGAHDRDVHKVGRRGQRRRPDEVPRLVPVAFAGAGGVHDDLGAAYGGFDPVADRKIARHELDAIESLSATPTGHPYLATGFL